AASAREGRAARAAVPKPDHLEGRTVRARRLTSRSPPSNFLRESIRTFAQTSFVLPMKTRSEVGTTSSLEFFTGRRGRSEDFGGWGPKRASVRGASQRFTSRRSRSTPIGDRRRRSPFRSFRAFL